LNQKARNEKITLTKLREKNKNEIALYSKKFKLGFSLQDQYAVKLDNLPTLVVEDKYSYPNYI
jgi:hypothetical protein